jgi:hypothetical protein
MALFEWVLVNTSFGVWSFLDVIDIVKIVISFPCLPSGVLFCIFLVYLGCIPCGTFLNDSIYDKKEKKVISLNEGVVPEFSRYMNLGKTFG